MGRDQNSLLITLPSPKYPIKITSSYPIHTTTHYRWRAPHPWRVLTVGNGSLSWGNTQARRRMVQKISVFHGHRHLKVLFHMLKYLRHAVLIVFTINEQFRLWVFWAAPEHQSWVYFTSAENSGTRWMNFMEYYSFLLFVFSWLSFSFYQCLRGDSLICQISDKSWLCLVYIATRIAHRFHLTIESLVPPLVSPTFLTPSISLLRVSIRLVLSQKHDHSKGPLFRCSLHCGSIANSRTSTSYTTF